MERVKVGKEPHANGRSRYLVQGFSGKILVRATTAANLPAAKAAAAKMLEREASRVNVYKTSFEFVEAWK